MAIIMMIITEVIMMKKDSCPNEKQPQKNSKGELTYALRIFINYGEGLKGSFGIGVDILMHGIQKHGSLSKAAEEMGMAYSKAWKIVKHMEDYLGFPMVIRQVGRGCGSSLTERGARFIKSYDDFLEEVDAFAKKNFKKHFENY